MINPKAVKEALEGFKGSVRRSKLGLGVFMEKVETWYLRNPLGSFVSSNFLPQRCVTDYEQVFRQNAWLLHANAKKALASRSADFFAPEDLEHFDKRRDWNRWRETKTLLDYFPSLKYSDTPLPKSCNPDGNVKLTYSESGKVRRRKGRFVGLARSHSLWLDALEVMKILYPYRLRIQNCIDWSYKHGLVPIMMTLTIYHRWHDLKNLLKILTAAWNEFTSNNRKRREIWGEFVSDWIRRLEITINDGTKEVTSNKGWHPHFHAILMIPKDKLQELSESEQEWRDAWVRAVCRHFEKIEGEVIPEGFVRALRRHGLLFSRDKKGQLRPVKDGKYLAKIMGYDNREVFGADKEMSTEDLKDSKTPFDLLMCSELPAGNIDLWCEYAMATKGVQAFRFSKGLEQKVKAYYEKHPNESSLSPCPDETIVATISHEVYQLLYHNFKLEDLKAKISEGYDALCDWFKQTFTELGCPELCSVPFAMPRPPT